MKEGIEPPFGMIVHVTAYSAKTEQGRLQFSVIASLGRTRKAGDHFAIGRRNRLSFRDLFRWTRPSKTIATPTKITHLLRCTTRHVMPKSVAFVQYRAGLCDGIANLR
jgi:hypothetical protein